jgi:hypothetical protein
MILGYAGVGVNGLSVRRALSQRPKLLNQTQSKTAPNQAGFSFGSGTRAADPHLPTGPYVGRERIDLGTII